jgi:hypothetical protein
MLIDPFAQRLEKQFFRDRSATAWWFGVQIPWIHRNLGNILLSLQTLLPMPSPKQRCAVFSFIPFIPFIPVNQLLLCFIFFMQNPFAHTIAIGCN